MNAIKWPDAASGYKDTGEGGLYVYAVIRRNDKNDPCCIGTPITMEAGSVMVDHTKFYDNANRHMVWLKERAFWPEFVDARDNPNSEFGNSWSGDDRPKPSMNSVRLSAAVLLGASSGAFWSESEENYFEVTYDDLTTSGKALVDALELLHDAPVELLTFLDT